MRSGHCNIRRELFDDICFFFGQLWKFRCHLTIVNTTLFTKVLDVSWVYPFRNIRNSRTIKKNRGQSGKIVGIVGEHKTRNKTTFQTSNIHNTILRLIAQSAKTIPTTREYLTDAKWTRPWVNEALARSLAFPTNLGSAQPDKIPHVVDGVVVMLVVVSRLSLLCMF